MLAIEGPNLAPSAARGVTDVGKTVPQALFCEISIMLTASNGSGTGLPLTGGAAFSTAEMTEPVVSAAPPEGRRC